MEEDQKWRITAPSGSGYVGHSSPKNLSSLSDNYTFGETEAQKGEQACPRQIRAESQVPLDLTHAYLKFSTHTDMHWTPTKARWPSLPDCWRWVGVAPLPPHWRYSMGDGRGVGHPWGYSCMEQVFHE